MLQGISLEWWRDARGYRLEEEINLSQLFPPRDDAGGGPPGFLSAFSFPEAWLASQPKIPGRIVRAGGSLISYRPVEMLDQIFNAYINTEPTPKGLLDFTNRFGPLTRAGLVENWGESVEFAINNLKCTVALIRSFSKTDKTVQRRALAELLGPDGFVFAPLKKRIVFDEQAQTLRTEDIVEDLASALWLRQLEIQASDIVMRKCGHCGAWFTAGMGTGRHLNARFCTDAHRIAFNSLKRTPKAA